MSSSKPARLALLSALAISIACGGGSRKVTKNGKIATPVLPPVNAEALRDFDSGMRVLRLGGPEAAEKAKPRLESAISQDGNLWEAWHNLGVVHFTLGEDDEAADAFGNALKINPAHVPSMLGRAEAHRRSGETNAARKDYERVISQRPEEKLSYARAASLLRGAGYYEDALDVIREGLRNAGADATIYVELGLIYLGQGRDELAELVLNKAAALDEKDPMSQNALALLALYRGKDQQAFERFDFASSLDPNFIDARFNKAAVLIDAGDYERARQELQTIVNLNKTDYPAKVALGVAHRGLGHFKQARRLWDDVVKSAQRRSRVRGDALYNLAILELDFIMENEKEGAALLARFLQEAPKSHPKRKEAEEKRKELGL